MKIPSEWTFHSNEVASAFDSHVREQLPWYDLITGAMAHVARHYIPDNGAVYDIGCSTGNVGRALADTISVRNASLIAIDDSPQMVASYNGPGRCILGDARTFQFSQFDLAICFLSMMFLPPKDRVVVMDRLRTNCQVGGAVIIVDKMLPNVGYPATIMTRLALAGKVATGTPAADILAKELSLSGVQRPLAPCEFEGGVEFFRFGDFAGWIFER